MATIELELFTKSLYQLLTETFEGPPLGTGSAYLDKRAGLFETLEALSAEQASTPASPGGTTIAAQVEHARFYIVVLGEFMRGRTERVEWSESWLVSRVTAEEWDELRASTRAAYEELAAYLRGLEAWGDDEIGDSMAILVHSAYHLGSIRQLLPRG